MFGVDAPKLPSNIVGYDPLHGGTWEDGTWVSPSQSPPFFDPEPISGSTWFAGMFLLTNQLSGQVLRKRGSARLLVATPNLEDDSPKQTQPVERGD